MEETMNGKINLSFGIKGENPVTKKDITFKRSFSFSVDKEKDQSGKSGISIEKSPIEGELKHGNIGEGADFTKDGISSWKFLFNIKKGVPAFIGEERSGIGYDFKDLRIPRTNLSLTIGFNFSYPTSALTLANPATVESFGFELSNSIVNNLFSQNSNGNEMRILNVDTTNKILQAQ